MVKMGSLGRTPGLLPGHERPDRSGQQRSPGILPARRWPWPSSGPCYGKRTVAQLWIGLAMLGRDLISLHNPSKAGLFPTCSTSSVVPSSRTLAAAERIRARALFLAELLGEAWL